MSVVIKHMNKSKAGVGRAATEFLRQTVAWIGCFAIVAQPLMAQTANITGDGGAQSPTVHTAANGVTVVLDPLVKLRAVLFRAAKEGAVEIGRQYEAAAGDVTVVGVIKAHAGSPS